MTSNSSKQVDFMNIQSLTTSEKIHLAEELWESVRANSDDLELTPEQRQLLDERLAAFKRDGSPGDSWQIVRDRILKRRE